jgi:hypothetical protein
MAAPRYKLNAAVVVLPDRRVLIAGGAPTAELFDPAASSFRPVAGDASMDLSFVAAARLVDGSVIVTGG